MAGRKLRYETPEEFAAAIEDYFDKCEGKMLEVDGKPVFDKYGHPVIIGAHPPTMTGLALHLGFTSRQAFLNYKGRKEFFDTYTRARARCEMYAEERLYDKDGARGAQFALQYGFGWAQEEQDAEKKVVLKIVDDL